MNKLEIFIQKEWGSDFKKIDFLDCTVGCINKKEIIELIKKFLPKSITILEPNVGRSNWLKGFFSNGFSYIDFNISFFPGLLKYDLIYGRPEIKNVGFFIKHDIYNIKEQLKDEKSVIIIDLPTCIDEEKTDYSAFTESKIKYINSSIDEFKNFLNDIDNRFKKDKIINFEVFFKSLGFKVLDYFDNEFNSEFKEYGVKSKTIILQNPGRKTTDIKFNPFVSKNKFSINDYENLLKALNENFKIITAEEFLKFNKQTRLNNFKKIFKDNRSRILIKHDIHWDLVSAIRMARLEKKLGIKSIYFTPHESTLTTYYFNKKEYLEFIQELSFLGHEVGIHCAIIELFQENNINNFDNFIKFLRANKIKINFANTHGTSSLNNPLNENPGSIKVFNSGYIFNEITSSTYLKDEYIPDHLKKYFRKLYIKDIIIRNNLQAWIDQTIFLEKSFLIPPITFTDNMKYIYCSKEKKLPEGTIYESSIFSEGLSINAKNIEDIIKSIKSYNSASFLFHPELYC